MELEVPDRSRASTQHGAVASSEPAQFERSPADQDRETPMQQPIRHGNATCRHSCHPGADRAAGSSERYDDKCQLAR
jgi:hypothetical protein